MITPASVRMNPSAIKKDEKPITSIYNNSESDFNSLFFYHFFK
jgi:hypothetical protein